MGFLSWSFPLFRVFGIAVRVHWFLAFLVAAYLLQGLAEGGLEGMRGVGITMAILFASILVHELAHCAAAIRVGAGADEIVLWPLGGLAYVGRTGSPRDDIRVAAAGPLASVLLCAACLGALTWSGVPWSWGHLNPFGSWRPFGLSLPQTCLLHAARLNEILALFNLCVPAYPLDGGRILLAFFTLRHGPLRAAELGAAAAVPIGIVLALWGFVRNDFLLASVGVWVLFEAYQLRRLSQEGGLEAHPAFGAGAPSRREERPGFLARWRARRAERRARREEERERELRRRVDEILEKIGREGMGSLTSAERGVLEEASRRRGP